MAARELHGYVEDIRSERNPAIKHAKADKFIADIQRKLGITEQDRRSHEREALWKDLNDLEAKIPYRRRLQMTYAPMCGKFYLHQICSLVCDIYAQSGLTDLKKQCRKYKENERAWINELGHSTHGGAIQQVEDITRWWSQDAMQDAMDKLHYAYRQKLSYDTMFGVDTCDLIAWLYAIRDLSNAVIAYDDETFTDLIKINPQVVNNIRRRQSDFSFHVRSFAESSLRSFWGKTEYKDFTDVSIATGKANIKKALDNFDPELSAQWLAIDYRAQLGKECGAERCRDCKEYRCAEIKECVEMAKKQY